MRILKKPSIEDFLFIDIETTYDDPEFNEESPMWDAWEYKQRKRKEMQDASTEDLIEEYFEWAAVDPTYGRIVCITIGIVRNGEIRLKTFSGDERELLLEFNAMLPSVVTNKTWLSGHAIKNFDARYVALRMMKHGVDIPLLLDVNHLKPWEIQYADTAELWRGPAFGVKTSSLIEVASFFGLPSPKEDISGKDVPKLFWNGPEGTLERIIEYCERDVATSANVVAAIRGEEPYPVAEKMGPPEPVGILTHLFLGGEFGDEEKKTLKKAFNSLKTDNERKMALDIINTLPTKAKGKETQITKKDIRELLKV